MKTPIAMMLMAISLSGCQSGPKQTPASEGTAVKDPAQVDSIHKKTGEAFTIELGSNHTTGYSWALDGKEDATVAVKVSNDYISSPHSPGMVGYGGTEHWKFRAGKRGTTVLHFIYRRPWEKDEKPIQKRSIKVVVE